VTSVAPIYKTLTIREPYQERHLEKHIKKKAVQHHHNRHTRSSATPTIIGALIGGAIGNELGAVLRPSIIQLATLIIHISHLTHENTEPKKYVRRITRFVTKNK
jgi:uncharacterized protein YcfJ